jgi:hypothetical protein
MIDLESVMELMQIIFLKLLDYLFLMEEYIEVMILIV